MDGLFSKLMPCCAKSRTKTESTQDTYYRSKSNFDEISIKSEQEDIEMKEIVYSESVPDEKQYEKSLSADCIEYNYMVCYKCETKATGFCAGCPGKRYCNNCYVLDHSAKSKFHHYCAYDDFKKPEDSISLKRRATITRGIKKLND